MYFLEQLLLQNILFEILLGFLNTSEIMSFWQYPHTYVYFFGI